MSYFKKNKYFYYQHIYDPYKNNQLTYFKIVNGFNIEVFYRNQAFEISIRPKNKKFGYIIKILFSQQTAVNYVQTITYIDIIKFLNEIYNLQQ